MTASKELLEKYVQAVMSAPRSLALTAAPNMNIMVMTELRRIASSLSLLWSSLLSSGAQDYIRP